MQSNRAYIIKKKPKVIIDRSFAIFPQLNEGDTGQLMMTGEIEGGRMEFQEDGVERIIKTVRMIDFELINNREARI